MILYYLFGGHHLSFAIDSFLVLLLVGVCLHLIYVPGTDPKDEEEVKKIRLGFYFYLGAFIFLVLGGLAAGIAVAAIIVYAVITIAKGVLIINQSGKTKN